MHVSSTSPISSPREFLFLARVPVMALQAQQKPLRYRSRHADQAVEVETVPRAGHDLATVADGGILCWAATVLQARHRAGHPLEEPLTVRTADLLSFLRSGGGKQRELLGKAIARLQHTRVTYTVGNGSQRSVQSFALMKSASQASERGTWTFELDRFFHDEIRAGRTLDVDPEALRLKGLKRRLYSLARERLGSGREQWDDVFRFVHDKSGSGAEPRRFRQMLHAAVADDDLPGYRLAVRASSEGEMLSVTRRKPDGGVISDMTGASGTGEGIDLFDLISPEDAQLLAAEEASGDVAPREIHLRFDDERHEP